MLYDCNHCSNQFSNKEALELHKLSDCFENEYPELVEFKGTFDHLEKTQEDPSWMCRFCPFSSQLKTRIAKHEKNKHANILKRKKKIKLRFKKKIRNKENIEPIITKSTKLEKEIPENCEPKLVEKKKKERKFYHSCLLCKDILTSFEDYLNHYQKEHQVPIQERNQCSVCSREFQHRSPQLEHVIGKHTNYLPFPCSECPRTFRYKVQAALGKHQCHKENFEKSKYFQCRIIGGTRKGIKCRIRKSDYDQNLQNGSN